MKILYVFCQVYRNHLCIKLSERIVNKFQEKYITEEFKMRGCQSNWNGIKKHGGIQGKVNGNSSGQLLKETMTTVCFVVEW
jgi:hypothetical protein